MNYSFKQIIEFLGIGAVVVSLLFVGYELRQARAIAQTEFRFQTVEQTRSLREYITENAEIWAKGCMNEDLSIEESVIFYNIAKSAMDH
ncbi:MAG: hypothetical protein RLN96_12000, partial [Pseudomonadales bacterium]